MIHVVAEIIWTLEVLFLESGLIESLGDRARHIGYTDEQGRYATLMAFAGCQFSRRIARDGSQVDQPTPQP